MINLFRFLVQNSSFFLFILFEFIALYLVVNYNRTQQAIFITSSSGLTSSFLDKSDQVHDYFNLEKINGDLSRENALLLKKMARLKTPPLEGSDVPFDFESAKIVSNNLSGRYNRFLINKGRSSGISKGMGVTANRIPVGIIFETTDNHASAISMLNMNFNLSVSIADKGYFGSLTWDPPSPNTASLNYVPAYADVQVGDTLTTSGYSQLFPAGLPVGVIQKVFTSAGSNSYEIDVLLFADMARLNYVHVIKNIDRTELDSLAATLEY